MTMKRASGISHMNTITYEPEVIARDRRDFIMTSASYLGLSPNQIEDVIKIYARISHENTLVTMNRMYWENAILGIIDYVCTNKNISNYISLIYKKEDVQFNSAQIYRISNLLGDILDGDCV